MQGFAWIPVGSDNWAELWLAKKMFYTVWVKIQPLKRMLTLLDFESFLNFPQIVNKSSACPVGVFSMRPNFPKCYVRQKKNNNKFTNKIKNPLELRLATRR